MLLPVVEVAFEVVVLERAAPVLLSSAVPPVPTELLLAASEAPAVEAEPL